MVNISYLKSTLITVYLDVVAARDYLLVKLNFLTIETTSE